MRDNVSKVRHRRVVGSALLGVTLAILPLFATREARADEARVRFLADKLRTDGDFRVRTNAALALGATNDDGAVEPLCKGLSDYGRNANESSEVVRQAAAVALKRLNRASALPCLRARASVERNDGVKVAIARAVEAISSNGARGREGGGDPIKDNPSAKYYVALSSVVNATGRGQAEVERIVLRAMRHSLDRAGNYQLAPSSESAERAREVMKKRNMKGFYLSITVDRIDYSAGYLRVKVKVGVCNYPNKALLGTLEKTVEDRGISTANKAAEDSLLEKAAALASDVFNQNASAFL